MIPNSGALTYLSRVVESLDYLKPETLMELPLSKLNLVLDNQDVEQEYQKIKRKRHTISEKDFPRYLKLLESNHNITDAKEMFKYVSQLYNDNTTLQDSINFIDYLKVMATIKPKKLYSMRLSEITQKLSITDVNFENFNEEKMLLHDIEVKY